MTVPDLLQYASVVIECIVAVIAVAVAVKKQKLYGWLIALTFVLYVVFDLARVGTLPPMNDAISVLFVVACLSMLGAVWLMYRE